MDKEKIKYTGGVLIVGSLYWEDSKIRKDWRENNLNFRKKVLIDLPIRYGRISSSRSCTYTMVYSSDCNTVEKLGKGYFLPFQQKAITLKQIIIQANKMICAEYNKQKEIKNFYWNWGCLGLVLNPKLHDLNTKTEEKTLMLLNEWRSHFDTNFNQHDYKVGEEAPIITAEGILEIHWPSELDNFDFVIGTATKPGIDKYPTSSKIAERILVNEYDEYFIKNVENSLSTFQDKEIEITLKNNISC